MPNIRYGKTLTITNMQMIITKIGFRPGQSHKVMSNMLIRIGIWKRIHRVHQGDIVDSKIGMMFFFHGYEVERIKALNDQITGRVAT
jgi:hypothetical protein